LKRQEARVILEESNKMHQKHAKLARPNLAEFGRNEIAIIGTTCNNIRTLANSFIKQLSSSIKIAYVDADHKSADSPEDIHTTLDSGGFLEYTNKISFQRLDFKTDVNSFQRRPIFNEQDLIIVNGNHFTAKAQIVVIDPVKNLEKKLEQLTDVRLILLKDKAAAIPDFLQRLQGFNEIPVLSLEDENGMADFIRQFLRERIPPINGLVLSGGLSTRMKKDKGELNYHGVGQREYLYEVLSKHCKNTFISCNAQQAVEVGDRLPVIQDSFLHLGPMGGILSALQTDPNAAWLTIAVDLPYLTETTVEYLIANRNPSKTATAFLDPRGEFPEPLITLWEPKSYLVMLQFLSQGYCCPRKVLINSDIQLLKAPNDKEFLNANSPEQYEIALKELSPGKK
jgi:molybdopterin-guanine dinucleotide biosynthesis protein A